MKVQTSRVRIEVMVEADESWPVQIRADSVPVLATSGISGHLARVIRLGEAPETANLMVQVRIPPGRKAARCSVHVSCSGRKGGSYAFHSYR